MGVAGIQNVCYLKLKRKTFTKVPREQLPSKSPYPLLWFLLSERLPSKSRCPLLLFLLSEQLPSKSRAVLAMEYFLNETTNLLSLSSNCLETSVKGLEIGSSSKLVTSST